MDKIQGKDYRIQKLEDEKNVIKERLAEYKDALHH